MKPTTWGIVQLIGSVLLLTTVDADALPSNVHAQDRQKFTNLTDHTSDYPENRVNGASIVKCEASADVIAAARKIFPSLSIDTAMLATSMAKYEEKGVASGLYRLLTEMKDLSNDHMVRVTRNNNGFSRPSPREFPLSFLKSVQEEMEDETSKRLATWLLNYQLMGWRSEKVSPTDVFERLELNTSPIDWHNPLYSVFVSYVAMHKTNGDKDAHEVLFDLLAEFHDAGALYEMVFAEENEKDRSLMPIIVDKMKRAIKRRWENEPPTAGDLFKRFFPKDRLDSKLVMPSHITLTSQVTEMLKSSRIKVWYTYVEKGYEGPAGVLLNQLLTFCSDRSEPVAQALADVRHEFESNKFARLAQAELFKVWRARKVSAAIALERLGIRDVDMPDVKWGRIYSWLIYIADIDPTSAVNALNTHIKAYEIPTLLDGEMTKDDFLDQKRHYLHEIWIQQQLSNIHVD